MSYLKRIQFFIGYFTRHVHNWTCNREDQNGVNGFNYGHANVEEGLEVCPSFTFRTVVEQRKYQSGLEKTMSGTAGNFAFITYISIG